MTMRERLYQMVEAELNLPQGWDTTKNFIELGGQSIQMMKLQMNILKTFGITRPSRSCLRTTPSTACSTAWNRSRREGAS